MVFLRSATLLFFFFVITACDKQASLVGVPTAAVPTPTPAPTTTTTPGIVDVLRTVTAGETFTFTNQTGGVSDTALDPTTGLPSIVYYDKNSTASGSAAVGALKFARMAADGTWRIEVIDANHGTAACGSVNSYCVGAPNAAGGNTASILRLAFTSTGRALVAYVFGASSSTTGGFKQLRFAERSVAGVWTISAPYSSSTAVLATNVATAATVDPMKGVVLVVDAADRPHILFTRYTQTLSNSSILYLFRSTGGAWSTQTVGPALSGAGTITALGQGANQAGGAYCSGASSGVFATSIVDGAAGVSKPLYIRCSTVDANGGCTAFTTLNLANGCGTSQSCFAATITTASNAGTRMDLHIDAGTNRPLLALYSVATPATTLLTTTAPLTCDQPQSTASGSWGTPVTVAAAMAGANGFRLAPSDASRNRNYLAYLLGTTAVLASKSTGPSGAWLATGHTVETTTVGAEGVGAAYDATNDQLYVSYAQLPAAAANAFGNDIKLAYAQDSEIVNAGAVGSFSLETVDNMSNAFPVAAVPVLDAARSSDGVVGFAFFYQDQTVGNSRLYYGIRSGTATAPVFAANPVVNSLQSLATPQLVGSYPSLTFDGGGNPALAFYDGRATAQDLVVARSSDGGSDFSLAVVDSVGNVGQFPSIASRAQTVAVAYYDATNTGLKFARFRPGQGWRRYAVDGLAGTGSCDNAADDAGSYATLRLTSTGRPVIAYQSQGQLRIAMAAEDVSSATFTWTCMTIDSGGGQRGSGIAFVLDATNAPTIVHFDASTGTQRHVACTQAVDSCITQGPVSFAGSLLASVGTVGTIVTKPSVQVTAAGTTWAAFYSAALQSLVLAQKPQGGAWSLESIDLPPQGATFPAAGGQYAVLLLNQWNLPMAFFRSFENWLKYFSRELQ